MLTHPKFVCIYTHDQDRALRFWTETVGWALRRDVPMGPDARWIEVQPPSGATYVVLSPAEGADDARVGGFGPVWWEVDDLDATFAELSARGVAFATEPAVADWDPAPAGPASPTPTARPTASASGRSDDSPPPGPSEHPTARTGRKPAMT